MRWTAVLFSIIFPGMGHSAMGRTGTGMALSSLFGLLVFMAAARGAMAEASLADDAFLALAASAAAVYAFALCDVVLAAVRAARAENSPEAENRLRAGMVAAAKGDEDEAEKDFRSILAVNPADVEAHLNLGALYARQGQKRKATRHLRRCSRFDVDGKWDWEVGQEMERLRD